MKKDKMEADRWELEDTGEVTRVREMTFSERQPELPIGTEGGGDDAQP